MKYVVYDKNTGGIIRTGKVATSAEAQLQAQAANERVLETDAGPNPFGRYRVDLATEMLVPVEQS